VESTDNIRRVAMSYCHLEDIKGLAEQAFNLRTLT